MNPICKKIYLELRPPGYGDSVADQDRILRALKPQYGKVKMPLNLLKSSYKLLRYFDWKLTVSIVHNGYSWEIVRIERGDTTGKNYAYAADLGSTTVMMQLVDLNSGDVIAEESIFNHQIPFGDEILSRIIYAKDHDEHLMEIQKSTLQNFSELMTKLHNKTGIAPDHCSVLVIGGNTTMIHFLFGIDPWCIFYTPYTPAFNSSGFTQGNSLGLPFHGLVYCFPSVANYVGGDIISGLLVSQMYQNDELALFMDIGTNGEMLLGNSEFMFAAAGAAGPALEGGVSEQGMKAGPGAVDSVKIINHKLIVTTIKNEKPIGICGSGIVDLLAEMFLEGWIDYAGRFVSEKSDRIVKLDEEEAVVYVWKQESGSGKDLVFRQSDIVRFMDTKAAANTMVAFLLESLEIEPTAIQRVYTAGAFGTYLNLESAITIGLYPDLPRDRFVQLGNGSLKGANMLLKDARLLDTAEGFIERITYLSLAEAKDFLMKMHAANFLPHTNFELYPTVIEKLKQRRNQNQPK